MLDMPKLRSAIDEAIDTFVDRVIDMAPKSPATEAFDISALGKEVLRIAATSPEGVTANQLADDTRVGLAPMFQELRDLMAANHLLRIVRREDELPVYMLPRDDRSRKR